MKRDRNKKKKKSADKLINYPDNKDKVTGTRPASPEQADEQSEFETGNGNHQDQDDD